MTTAVFYCNNLHNDYYKSLLHKNSKFHYCVALIVLYDCVVGLICLIFVLLIPGLFLSLHVCLIMCKWILLT